MLNPVDALWHLANFFAPALAIGTMAAGLGKLLWHRPLRGISWWRLARGAILADVVVLTTGLIAFGRDGKMATYGATVAATALTLWWIGFARRR